MRSIWHKQRQFLKQKRDASKNKFGAKRTADGFPSKLERAVYEIVLKRQMAGELKDVRRQHRVDLIAKVSWKIDFSAVLVATGETIFIEAKGIETADFKIKKKLFKEFGQGKLEIWKGSYTNPFLAEVICPVRLDPASQETLKPRKLKSRPPKKQSPCRLSQEQET